MAQITCKELSALSDLLSAEEMLASKYADCASQTTDSTLKNQFEQMSLNHQRHYDELFSHLK